jgi:hypothetical protein
MSEIAPQKYEQSELVQNSDCPRDIFAELCIVERGYSLSPVSSIIKC